MSGLEGLLSNADGWSRVSVPRPRTAARWLGAVFAYVRRSDDQDWKPAPQPETPDIETARLIAWELVYDNMHFHERAMADPFGAESYVQDAGRRLLAAVGYPSDVRVYSSPLARAEADRG